MLEFPRFSPYLRQVADFGVGLKSGWSKQERLVEVKPAARSLRFLYVIAPKSAKNLP
jgi:hypothetical protein